MYSSKKGKSKNVLELTIFSMIKNKPFTCLLNCKFGLGMGTVCFGCESHPSADSQKGVFRIKKQLF